jgi:aryl-alcohol dehydrogenase-like predicted oxidoreductase
MPLPIQSIPSIPEEIPSTVSTSICCIPGYFFDTANVYPKTHSEEIIGELLKDHRDEIAVATKVYGQMGDKLNQGGLALVHVSNQIESSLKRLQTDHVNLYQIHRLNYETPIEEIARLKIYKLNQILGN